MLKNRDKPFSQENLNSIFKVSTKYANRVNSRESSWLEFKERFGFASLSKYAKTMAAFANAQGGYIVFGVKDKPHTMMGLRDETFNGINPEKITNGLNEIFAPEIHWEMNVHEFKGKMFGLIYTHESVNKPIVAKKNSGEVKESEIYYRYRGRSEKAKYSELILILDERRKQEQLRWMKHLENISRIGVENAAVFDTDTGIVEGSSGRFIIDEAILPKLSFIREGEFSERDGDPTLKLIGELQAAGKTNILPIQKVYATKSRGIRTDDIISDFLNQIQVDSPTEYVRQICWESSFNLPVYYYIAQSDDSFEKTLGILEEVETRNPVQGKLLEKLCGDRSYSLTIPNSRSSAALRKSFYREQLSDESLNASSLPTDLNDIKYAIQAMQTFTEEETNLTYLLELLKYVYANYYMNKAPDISGVIRYAICHLDVIFFRDKAREQQ